MNYLAHAYLSFNNPGILVGNMISDFVKGKKQYDYPDTIQKGIRLHRAIDTFTDQHPATRAAKQLFKPAVGPYAGAFIDVVYDHFLAADETELAEPELLLFAKGVYTQLAEQQSLLPEKFAGMLPYMTSQNWLYHYRSEYGIEKSFGGLVRRASYLDDASAAFSVFRKEYAALQDYYRGFFPDVKTFASSHLAELLSQ
jgi:acyl carrier protein phosphodiesterase